MSGFLVHLGSITNCLHGGAVTTPPPSPPRVFVNFTQPVLSMKEIHAVAGCLFQIPVGFGTKPQPCVTIRVQPATRVFINGSPAATFTPTTLGYSAEQIPQGPPNAGLIQKRVIAT